MDLEGADSFLVDNILKQCDGLEVQVLGDKKASKALEPVLRVCTPLQVRGLLHRVLEQLGSSDAPYAELCSNPYASHALETLLARAGAVAATEADAGPAAGEDGVLRPPLATLLVQLRAHLGADLLGMSGNRAASHVLRALMLCCGGVQWASAAAARSFNLATGLVPCAQVPPPALGALHDDMARALVAALGADAADRRHYCCDSSASATLQVALVACEVSARLALRDELVAAVAGDAGEALALMQDAVGSRLMEVVLDRCAPATFTALWDGVVAPHARELALHGSANFVLQKAMQRAGATQHANMDTLLESLCSPSLTALFRLKRTGVLVELVRAAGALRGASGASWRARVLPLLWQSDVPRPLLVQLLGEVRAQGAGVARPTISLACAMHGLGPEGAAVLDAFWDALSEDDVRTVCTCRAWSEVAESFLRGGGSAASKRKLVRKCQTHWLDIARDKYGHHVALACLEWLGDEDALAKELVRTLKSNREVLVKVQWGDKLLKKVAERAERKHTRDAAPAPLTVEALLGEELKEEARHGDEKKKKDKKKRKQKKRAKESGPDAARTTDLKRTKSHDDE